MRFPIALFLAALSFSPVSFASTSECSCTQECSVACRKGHSENCQCKECHCKESGSCDLHRHSGVSGATGTKATKGKTSTAAGAPAVAE